LYTTETKLTVRYAETDQMGIVHHSVYPVWYEAARTDFIKKSGKSYSDIEKSGILLPLIELNVKYRGSSLYEDEVIIETHIEKLTATRLVFGYRVYRNEEKTVINEGSSSHVWTDLDLKPVNLIKKRPELYRLLEQKTDIIDDDILKKGDK
jgi:acyl-CoA thioester hydrolase